MAFFFFGGRTSGKWDMNPNTQAGRGFFFRDQAKVSLANPTSSSTAAKAQKRKIEALFGILAKMAASSKNTLGN